MEHTCVAHCRTRWPFIARFIRVGCMCSMAMLVGYPAIASDRESGSVPKDPMYYVDRPARVIADPDVPYDPMRNVDRPARAIADSDPLHACNDPRNTNPDRTICDPKDAVHIKHQSKKLKPHATDPKTTPKY